MQQDGTCWWSDIPRGLFNKVNGRLKGQSQRAGVDYVALGHNDSYFLQFEDGSQFWDGPDALTEALKGRRGGVELLTFGPDDGWYVMWDDGAVAWEGIPQGLHNQVHGRMHSMPNGARAATVEEVAVGPEGEWFVRYANGDWRANLAGRGMREAMDELQAQGDDVVSVAFGYDDTWAIRY